MMKVKAQPGQQCRLTDSLCIKDKPVDVEPTATVRRRLRDGSLTQCKNTRKKSEKTMHKTTPKTRGKH